MLIDITEPVTSESYVSDILIAVSDEIDETRKSRPSYALYRQKSESWEQVLKGLSKALWREYDREVEDAFYAYQKVAEDYFFALGVDDAIHGRFRFEADYTAGVVTPGLDCAENRLEQVCRHFARQLAPDDRESFSAYYEAKKEMILDGRYIWYRYGLEFIQGLFRRVQYETVS